MDPTHDQLCRAMQSVARVMIEMPSVAKQDVQRCEPSITQMTWVCMCCSFSWWRDFYRWRLRLRSYLRHVIASQPQQQQQRRSSNGRPPLAGRICRCFAQLARESDVRTSSRSPHCAATDWLTTREPQTVRILETLIITDLRYRPPPMTAFCLPGCSHQWVAAETRHYRPATMFVSANNVVRN